MRQKSKQQQACVCSRVAGNGAADARLANELRRAVFLPRFSETAGEDGGLVGRLKFCASVCTWKKARRAAINRVESGGGGRRGLVDGSQAHVRGGARGCPACRTRSHRSPPAKSVLPTEPAAGAAEKHARAPRSPLSPPAEEVSGSSALYIAPADNPRHPREYRISPTVARRRSILADTFLSHRFKLPPAPRTLPRRPGCPYSGYSAVFTLCLHWHARLLDGTHIQQQAVSPFVILRMVARTNGGG